MANADIQLLFGVLGDGALGGESGNLIKEQLTQIVSALNKNPLKVKVALDTEAGGQKSWSSQVQTKLNTLSTNGKFSVQISKLGIGAGAISDFKKQLNAVINTLNLDKGTSITLNSEGIGEVKKAFGDAGTEINNAALKVAAFNVRLRELGSQGTNIKNALSTLNTAASTEDEQAQLSILSNRYKQLAIDIEAVHISKTKDPDALVKIENEASAIQQEIDAIKQKKQAEEASRKAAEESARQAQRESQNNAKIRGTITERNALYRQTSDAITKIESAQRNWSAAATGSSKSEYQKFGNYISGLQELQKEFDGLSKTEIQERISAINKEFSSSSGVIKGVGENTKTLTDRMGGLASKFASWLTVSQVIMQAYRTTKQMVSAVIEIDTAMTELKKVTDETESTYSRFLENAVVRSKELGATVSDVVSASADFARLGYSLTEASDLADAALIYKNVGDGIRDVGEASESIISTMKAFKIEASNAMSIVDKFNEVGNNFAISSKGVGDALIRSASALAAANNTLDESIALITAANNVVQNPEKVGNTLKTVSMFLRASKTEAEEAGESTDGMANSVSELRKELLALTGSKLDIQIDEDTYKSTYQILKELSTVWDDLTDVSQANILEMIGGKRNSNVVAAILTNFETAEKVLATAADSAGSAFAENEKFLNSIKGTIAEFKVAFQELSITLIDSEFVKDVIELGTGLLGILNSVAELIDILGGLNTVLYVTAGTIAIIKADSIVIALTKLGAKIKGFVDTIRIALMYFSDGFTAARKAGSSFTQSVSGGFQTMAGTASTAQVAVAALVAVISAVVLLKNALEEADRKLIETQEQIIEKNAAQRESNKAFEDAYVTYMRYADKVEITASEETALNDAIKTITDTIGKKSDALHGLTGKTEEYTEALKAQTKAELEDAYAIAIENRDAAQKKLMKEASPSWKNKITIDLSGRTGVEEFVAAKNTLRELMGDYFDQGTHDYELEPINWDTLQNTPDGVNAIVDYYYDLLEVEKELALQGNTNNDIYNRAKEITNSLAGSVTQYVRLKYEEIAAEYKFQNGIPDTIDEFKKYREYLHTELGSMFTFDDGGDALTKTIDEFLSSYGAYSEFMSQVSTSTNYAAKSDELNRLAEALKQLTSDTDDLRIAMNALSASPTDFDKLFKGDDGKKYLDSLLSTFPQLRDELQAYSDGIMTSTELQRAMNNTIANFNSDKLGSQIKGAVDATQEYGDGSFKVVQALQEMDAVLPGISSILLNEETALRAVESGAYDSAKAMIEFIRAEYAAKTATSQADYENLVKEYGNVTNAALTAAAAVWMKNKADEATANRILDLMSKSDSEYKPKSSESKEKDPQLEAFEKEVKRLDHLRAMDKISEDIYLQEKLAALQTYLKDREKYQTQWWAWEEEVHNRWKKLKEEEIDNLEDRMDEEIDANEEYYKNLKKQKEKEYEAEEDRVNKVIDQLERELDAKKKAIQKQKDLLNEQSDNREYEKTVSEKNKEIADIRAQLTALDLDNSAESKAKKIELQEELTKALSDLEDYQYDHSIETQQNALDDEETYWEDHFGKLIEEQEAYLENLKNLYDQAIESIESSMEAMSNSIKANFEAMIAGIQAQLDNAGNLSGMAEITPIGGNSDATALQQMLTNAGYGGYLGNTGDNKDGIDGKIGSKTIKALQAFLQASVKPDLKIDGIIGPKTKAAIEEAIRRGILPHNYALYHSGGVVGQNITSADKDVLSALIPIDRNEVVSKLLKGEVVANEDQQNMVRQAFLSAASISPLGNIQSSMAKSIAGISTVNNAPSVKFDMPITIGNTDTAGLAALQRQLNKFRGDIMDDIYKSMSWHTNKTGRSNISGRH